jgi:hypothetical protein
MNQKFSTPCRCARIQDRQNVWEGLEAANWDCLCHWLKFFRDDERRRTGPQKRKWIFRGQRKGDWKLETSLGRLRSDFKIPSNKVVEFEEEIIRCFQRTYYLHGSDQIDRKNSLAWLALMQHHGAPTRLLDFTYSFWVALFFAVERAGEADKPAIWAVDLEACYRRCPIKSSNDEDRFWENTSRWSDYFGARRPRKLVYPVNTFQLGDRLSIQQGIFLCPADVRYSFEENLEPKLASRKGSGEPSVFKIQIDSKLESWKEIVFQLHHMNVNRATLFPGIDGLAQSLWMRPAFLS